ncbi:hypothetical protein NBRC111894_2791 [Sporolactobacillus inulinus]|uniref:Uncharacterized protein n=1 Tax=Sporolactobacillus inulinus TaxID=2078 RepID=A0A4Y1ZDQ0_9BACL|nr:hypothetical protein NBRC111894_2791 [Sporolactobacillus inulinus]
MSIGAFRSAMLPLMHQLLARPAHLRDLLLQRVRKTSIAERSVQLGLITAFSREASSYGWRLRPARSCRYALRLRSGQTASVTFTAGKIIRT